MSAFSALGVPRDLPAAADPRAVLAIYADAIAELKHSDGYTVADVIGLPLTTPEPGALRAQFLAEHTHDEDEMRFFVEGGRTIFLRADGKGIELSGASGDLIRVPAGACHWFDVGDPPFFTCIRLFTRPDGWVGTLTGDPIPDRFRPRAA